MRWSELKQDIMVWSSLKHMLWSVFWKTDSKIIGFSKLFMAKSALKLNFSYIAIRYIFTHKRHWYLNFYLPHWQIQQTVFHLTRLLFSKTQFMEQSILNAKDLQAKGLARSCFSNKAIICQLPCGHMTISPQPWGFRVVDTVKSLFLHSLIANIGRLSLHTIFNSLWG